MNRVNKKTRIAIQKNGRLFDGSIKYLREKGYEFDIQQGQLIAEGSNDTELLLVRNSDIPEYMKQKVADMAIVGENVLVEKDLNFKIIERLDFAKCKLVIAVLKDSKIKKLEDLNLQRIATSYPKTLRKFLKKNKINAAIIEIKGSVEACPKLGMSDAVFDVVQTGKTLKVNNLEVLAEVATSQALLISN
jgi:ATP phosphoribosyltransferase